MSAHAADIGLRSRNCPNPECGRSKSPDKAFCGSCWHRLPHLVRNAVWASYDTRTIGDHLDFLDSIGRRLAAGSGPWPT